MRVGRGNDPCKEAAGLGGEQWDIPPLWFCLPQTGLEIQKDCCPLNTVKFIAEGSGFSNSTGCSDSSSSTVQADNTFLVYSGLLFLVLDCPALPTLARPAPVPGSVWQCPCRVWMLGACPMSGELHVPKVSASLL